MLDQGSDPNSTENSRLDSFAAVALIFLAVVTAVFWLSQL